METLYPITMEMKIAITNEDGSATGTITYEFGGGLSPKQEDIVKAFDETIAQLPDGYRPMSRHEHFLFRIKQRTGQLMRLAMPNVEEGQQWHDPAMADKYCNWGSNLDENFEEDA